MENQVSGHSSIMSPSIWSEDQKSSTTSWPVDTELNTTAKLEELTTVTFQGETTAERSSDLNNVYDLNRNITQNQAKKLFVNGNGGDDKRKPSTTSSMSADENHNDVTINKAGVCAVCGDKASGKHYGQITCEGCKSFFKRSVRKDLHYSCRGSRDCAIDTQHRNQCQYCRLRKCVKAGMRKEAVQRGRVNQTSQLEYPCPMPQIANPAAILESGQPPRIIPHNYMSDILTILLRAEPFNHPDQSHIFPTGPVTDMESVQQISQSLFYSIIEWMRRILPHFIDLSVQDQDALIHGCLSELFVMSLVQWYAQVNISSLFNVIVSYLRENNMNIDSLTYIHQQIEKLYRLRIDSAECSFIKAIIAFNPDNLSLTDPHSIATLQERFLSALEDYEKIYYNTQPNRFGKLLIRIPALKSISLTQIEQSFFCTDRKLSPLGITGLIRSDMYATATNCWQPIPDHNMVNLSTNNS